MAFYTILTDIGKAKLANATALGTTVSLQDIAVGDGGGVAVTPQTSDTALTNEVWRAALNNISIDSSNANWIVCDGYIPSDVGDFTVREVGLFDADGDMIAVGNYPDTYKPTLASGSAKDLYIKVIIEVSDAGVVELKVDPSVVLATRKYVDDETAKRALRQGDNTLTFKVADAVNADEAIPLGQSDAKYLQNSISQEFTGKVLALSNIYSILSLDDQTAPDGLGIKRISCNDGGGNLNIRSGSYFDAAEKYTTANQGAVHIQLMSETTTPYVNIKVAPAGVNAGDAIAYSKTFYIDEAKATIDGKEILTDAAKSLSTSGYQKLSNGLIIQWGFDTTTYSGGLVTITFPIAFPNSVFTVNSNKYISGDTDGGAVSAFTSSMSLTGFSMSTNAAGCVWIAIGY